MKLLFLSVLASLALATGCTPQKKIITEQKTKKSNDLMMSEDIISKASDKGKSSAEERPEIQKRSILTIPGELTKKQAENPHDTLESEKK